MLFLMPAFGCPDLGAVLTRAEEDLTAVRSDAVEQDLLDAEAALGCGQPASRESVGRLWLIEGVHATVIGDPDRAEQAFSALARTDVDSWNDVYGDAVRERYEAAGALPRGIAKITLSPTLGSNQAFLDGVPAKQTVNSIAGLHTVQVADHLGVVQFGRVVFLAPDQTLELETGIAPGPPIVREDRRRVKKPGLLLVGIGLLAAGGGLAVAATAENRNLRTAPTLGKLDAAFARQIGFAAGAGVAVIGAAGTTWMFGRSQRH